MTLNNFTPEELDKLLDLECEEICICEEVGEEGTPHLHAYIHMGAQVRLSTMKKLQPRAHWDVATNRAGALNYVRKGIVLKDNCKEEPEKPKAGSTRLQQCVQCVREIGLQQLPDVCPEGFVLWHKGLQKLEDIEW